MSPLSLKTTTLLFIVAFLLSFTFLLSLGGCRNIGASKLREVRQIWTTIPIYPGATHFHQSIASQPQHAMVSNYYKSSASFEDLRQFYQERLSESGWLLIADEPVYIWGEDMGGRKLTFRKDEYEINLEYAGRRTNDWDYALSVSWGF